MKSRILVIDDHSIVRLGMENLISKNLNASTYGASTLQEGRAIMDKTRIDLIILDIGIPDWEGMDVIRQLKETMPDAGLLICSAHNEIVYAMRCLDAGADGYLQKTIDQEEMGKAIVSVLNGNQYVSEKVKEYILETRLNNRNSGIDENPLNLLTERELEVCELLQKGFRNNDIAIRLKLHASTISTYKIRIFQKLNVSNTNALVEKMKLYDPFIG